jgi:hypothetical protein
LILGALAVAASGCGGGKNSDDRAKVERFIQQANAVQADSAPAFKNANKAYLAFSRGKLPPTKAARDLAAAETAMRSTRDRLSALAAPKSARELQRRLVALFDTDAAFAHESTLLAQFMPASQSALQPLQRIGKRLSRNLRKAKGPAAQEAALRDYAARTERVIRKLQPLHPPPILIGRHSEQVQHLQSTRALALKLAAALKAQDSRRIARLLLSFRRLNASGWADPLSPAAVRAYNRRYLQVRRALQSVDRERTRLERKLRG